LVAVVYRSVVIRIFMLIDTLTIAGWNFNLC